MFVIVPAAAAPGVAVSVIVLFALTGNALIEQITRLPDRLQPPEADAKDTPTGSASVTITPVAANGPFEKYPHENSPVP